MLTPYQIISCLVKFTLLPLANSPFIILVFSCTIFIFLHLIVFTLGRLSGTQFFFNSLIIVSTSGHGITSPYSLFFMSIFIATYFLGAIKDAFNKQGPLYSYQGRIFLLDKHKGTVIIIHKEI